MVPISFSCVHVCSSFRLPSIFSTSFAKPKTQESKPFLESTSYLICNLSLLAASGFSPMLAFPGPTCSSAVHSDHRFILQTERTPTLPGTGLWVSSAQPCMGREKLTLVKEPKFWEECLQRFMEAGVLSVSLISNVSTTKSPTAGVNMHMICL